MERWDECLFLEGKKDIQKHFAGKEHAMLILGKGFDPRACRMLEILKDLITDMTVCMVDYNDRTVPKSENNESRSEENYKNIKEMCSEKKLS